MNTTPNTLTQSTDHTTDLATIARQLGEVRCYLDMGCVAAARAQLEHTQTLAREAARTARLDAMFPVA